MNPPHAFNPFGTGSTAGKYFVGRDEELKKFRSALTGLKSGRPNHLYIAGVHRTGKTSYLEKLCDISRSEAFLGVMPTLDESRLAHAHIGTILRALLENLEYHNPFEGRPLTKDWDQGKESKLFCHPKKEDIESDQLRRDFKTIEKLIKEAGLQGAVVCIDEGQRIHPRALSALKNSLQQLSSFLIVISLRLVVESNGAELAGRSLLDGKAQEAEGDFGASRFYGRGIPLGQFASDWEAARCVGARLEDNIIQFNPLVIDKIGILTSRIPGDIIQLSSQLYDLAAERNASIADIGLLKETFRRAYRSEIAEAETACDAISQSAKSALRSLISLKGTATVSDITNHAFPHAPEDQTRYLKEGVRADLDRVSKICNSVMTKDDSFEFLGITKCYAFELALETC